MNKWEIWYSYFYCDIRPHGGNSAFIVESPKKPSKRQAMKEVKKHISDWIPRGARLSIDAIYHVENKGE